MQIRKFLYVALLLISVPAAAEFQTVEKAYEVTLSFMRVPITSTQKLSFSQCADCEEKVIPMTRNTRFIVNGKDVGLKEFRKRVHAVRDRDREVLIVMHNLESDTVTSIKVNL